MASRAVNLKTPEGRERAEQELIRRIIPETIGNLGYIPFYKDLRRIFLKDYFKDFNKNKKKSEESFLEKRRGDTTKKKKSSSEKSFLEKRRK